jgi:ribosome-associated protein
MCTATSTTHVKALTDEIEFKLKEQGVTPSHIEGHKASGWILMDSGSVIIHIFTQEAREFYALERLWSEGKEVSIDEA